MNVFQCSLVLVFSCVAMCAGPVFQKWVCLGWANSPPEILRFFFKSFSAVLDSPTPHQFAHWSYVGTSCETLSAIRLDTGARTRSQQRSPDAHSGWSRTFKKTPRFHHTTLREGSKKRQFWDWRHLGDTLTPRKHRRDNQETCRRDPGKTPKGRGGEGGMVKMKKRRGERQGRRGGSEEGLTIKRRNFK